eukprot:jgi/Chrpa1/27007/Chrysochromulina_OHIO_Genome00007399-RA
MTKAARLLFANLLACAALTLPMHQATPHTLRATAPRMLFGGGGKGGEGGGLNMMETIKKAQQVGVKVKALQEELAQTEIEAISADGGCTVVISGAQVPISVEVTEALLAKGSKAVSEAVSVAAKEAHTNSVSYAQEQMATLYAEIGLPIPPTQ